MHLFFNSSMPRSGSELLQAILHQNPSIYASTTSPLLEYQFAARSNYELPEVKSQEPELMQKAFLAMCKSMADGYYSALTDRPYVIDKNRGWSHYYEWLDQWCPSPKIICMVRDLRSILASMERIYRSNRFRPIGPDNPQQLQNMTVDQRVSYWLSTQPIGIALQRTHDLFQRRMNSHILFVRYEDLCSDPSNTLAGIYRYLEIPAYEHNFDEIEKRVVEDDSHFGPYGSHKIKRKLAVQESDWRELLTPSSAGYILDSARWYFESFYLRKNN